VVAPFHSLSRRESIALKELSQSSAALPDNSFGVRRHINRMLSRTGVELKLLVTTNSILATTSMAREGAVYTLMPRFAVTRDCEARTLVAIPLNDQDLELSRVEICMHRSRTLPVAPREFLSSLVADLSGSFGGPTSRTGVPTRAKGANVD